MAEEDRARQRVLEAAGPLFATRGFDAVSVRDITEKAGTNVAAVNYHFGGKEKLYVESVRHAARALEQFSPMPDYPPGTPAEVRLRGFIQAFLTRILGPNGPVWQRELILREVNEPRPGACEEFVRQFARPNFDVLLEIVREICPPAVAQEALPFIAGSVIGQMLHYHHCRHVIHFLIGPDGQKGHTIEVLTEHVQRFSLAAMRGYAAGGG